MPGSAADDDLTLDIGLLRHQLGRLLDRVEQDSGLFVGLRHDYSWRLDPAGISNVSEPPEPSMGQLSDDLDELQAMALRADDELVLWHDLGHIVGLLNALAAEATNPPAAPQKSILTRTKTGCLGSRR